MKKTHSTVLKWGKFDKSFYSLLTCVWLLLCSVYVKLCQTFSLRILETKIRAWWKKIQLCCQIDYTFKIKVLAIKPRSQALNKRWHFLKECLWFEGNSKTLYCTFKIIFITKPIIRKKKKVRKTKQIKWFFSFQFFICKIDHKQ